SIHKKPVEVAPDAIEQQLTRFREAYARFQPVEDRGAELGDTVVMNMTRRKLSAPAPVVDAPGDATVEGTEAGAQASQPAAGDAKDEKPESLDEVGVELGAPSNPPGFDDHLLGTSPGSEKTFRVTFPGDYGVESLAGSEVEYAVNVTGVRRKVLP